MVEGILEEEFAALAAPLGSVTPRYQVMDRADIRSLVGMFAAAAERAKRAGVDGVEIHAGHGYILSAFLSPATNQRSDQYGGSVENRSRLLTEVLQGIRNAVGCEFPVWCRLDSQEFFQPEGISLEDAKATARLAQAAGADAVHASAYADAKYGIAHSSAHTPQQPALLVNNATAIRSVVRIPVIAVGRIEPEAAESHIAAGRYDFVAMGRKLLADPELPRKLAAREPESIRPCVYRYACNSQIYIGGSVRCAVNPETGHESDLCASSPIVERRIAVIGGGLAGMEAARRLALKGHRVTLFEQEGQLGGALLLASRCYEPNEALLIWLINSIRKLPIEVILNNAATPASLRTLEPEIVVLALGAQMTPEARDAKALSDSKLRELVFDGDSAATFSCQGCPIAVIGNDLEALQLASFFARRRYAVTLIGAGSQFGQGVPLVLRWRVLHELRDCGATLLAGARDISIEKETLSYTNRFGQTRTIAAKHVVTAKRTPRNIEEFFILRNEGITVHGIGDCQQVAYIDGAMRSAATLASSL